MAERLAYNEAQVNIFNRIGRKALTTVVDNYGAGFPHWGQNDKRYHNGHHTTMTAFNSKLIASHSGLDTSEQAFAEAIGMSHDLVFEGRRGIDEKISADWIEKELRDSGRFERKEAKLAGLAIIGTIPIFDAEGNLIDQTVNRMDFPSKRAQRIAGSVSSADMAEIVSSYGSYLAQQLYGEFHGARRGTLPPMAGFPDFQERQVRLIKNYRFPLGKVAEAAVDPQGLRPRIIRYTEHVNDQMHSASPLTWHELERQNYEFGRDPYKAF